MTQNDPKRAKTSQIHLNWPTTNPNELRRAKTNQNDPIRAFFYLGGINFCGRVRSLNFVV